jgi:hypothetical protein
MVAHIGRQSKIEIVEAHPEPLSDSRVVTRRNGTHGTPPTEREERERREGRVRMDDSPAPVVPEACEATEGGSNEPPGKVIRRRSRALGGVEVASERVLGG